MKTTYAIIEKAKDGSFSVYTKAEDLPYGLNGNGDTLEEAKADFLSGYEDLKQFAIQNGESFVETEFSYIYDVPSFLADYAYAFTLAGLERITGINQKQLGHYISGFRRPSPKTAKRMEDKIHEFSETLSSVRFL